MTEAALALRPARSLSRQCPGINHKRVIFSSTVAVCNHHFRIAREGRSWWIIPVREFRRGSVSADNLSGKFTSLGLNGRKPIHRHVIE